MKNENEIHQEQLKKTIEGLNRRIQDLESKQVRPTHNYCNQWISSKGSWLAQWHIPAAGQIAHLLLILGIVLCAGGFLFLLTSIFNTAWIKPTFKVILCIVGAFTFFTLSFIFKKDRFFAQIMAGLGSFLLYLALYAFFVFFPIFSQPLVLIAFGMLIAATSSIALYWHMRVFAFIATAGGFLVPWLFYYQTGIWAHQALLVGYLTFLALGTTVINLARYWYYKKSWPELIILSLIALAFYFTIYLTTHRTIGLSLFVLIAVGTFIITWLEQSHQRKEYPHSYFFPAVSIILLGFPVYWINAGFLAQCTPLNVVFMFLYGLILYLIGLYNNYQALRLASYATLVYANALFITKIYYYKLVHPIWAIYLHIVYGCSVLTIITLLLINHYKKNRINQKEYALVHEYGSLTLALIAYSWGYNTLVLWFDRLSQPKPSFLAAFFEYTQKNDTLVRSDLTEAILSVYSSIGAGMLLIISFIKKQRLLSYAALAIALWTLCKFSMLLLNSKDMNLKIATSFILGACLIATGIIYKKKNN